MTEHRTPRYRWVWPVSAVCLVMGALLAVQVRSRETPESFVGFREARTINAILVATRAHANELEAEVKELKQNLTQYENSAGNERETVKLLNQALQESKIVGGLLAVKGPGVKLVLDDSARLRTPGADSGFPGGLLIHNMDLLQVVNELWAAGAEAISLNGQRIVGNSYIRCVGPVVQVNTVPIGAPYTFLAIGDSDALASGMNLPGGVLDGLRSLEFQVKLTKEKEVLVPAASVTPKVRYARVAEESKQ